MFKKTLFVVALLLFCLPAVAQEKELSKGELIGKFAELTKSNNVNIKVELSIDDVNTKMSSLINDDKDLTSDQKVELRNVANDLLSKLAKDTEAAFSSSQILAMLGEEVVTRVYDEAFTASELKELVAFFSTPLGQKAAAFMSTSAARIEDEFKTRMQKKIQDVSKPLIDASMDTLRQRVQDIKKK